MHHNTQLYLGHHPIIANYIKHGGRAVWTQKIHVSAFFPHNSSQWACFL